LGGLAYLQFFSVGFFDRHFILAFIIMRTYLIWAEENQNPCGDGKRSRDCHWPLIWLWHTFLCGFLRPPAYTYRLDSTILHPRFYLLGRCSFFCGPSFVWFCFFVFINVPFDCQDAKHSLTGRIRIYFKEDVYQVSNRIKLKKWLQSNNKGMSQAEMSRMAVSVIIQIHWFCLFSFSSPVAFSAVLIFRLILRQHSHYSSFALGRFIFEPRSMETHLHCGRRHSF
jgi:hypothetical protein